VGKNHNVSKKWFRSGFRLIFGHVFEIKFVEMGEAAVPAPDDKVPAADRQVVRTGNMAVPASGCLDKFPEIVTADLRVCSFFTDILNPGYKNTGCPTVVADYLGLVRNGPDDLVGVLSAMVAVRTIPRQDKLVGHRRE